MIPTEVLLRRYPWLWRAQSHWFRGTGCEFGTEHVLTPTVLRHALDPLYDDETTIIIHSKIKDFGEGVTFEKPNDRGKEGITVAERIFASMYPLSIEGTQIPTIVIVSGGEYDPKIAHYHIYRHRNKDADLWPMVTKAVGDFLPSWGKRK